nr:hypothetical protein [Tanacetum cinerariifolium]
MIRAQVGDLSLHSIKYSSPALTQKVFANIRRVGKGFSGVDTPLFEGMLVAHQVDESAAEVNVDDVPAVGVTAEGATDVITDVVLTAADEPIKSSLTPTTPPPPPSQDNNKPYFKIIRADGTYQLFLSFLSLLRNFDREDLDVLWEFVKERFASSKPKNFSDDFLLTTLTYMFEKPDVQAQMILLVERRYLLTRFTLDQMLNNVRLEVEGKSEVSLELLKFVRQQQQEGFRPE